jgi:hypothetical protein
MATEEQLAAFQTAVASGNIQEAANIAASAGYSPQQVAEYVNANAPILGLGPETGFSGVTAANLNPYFVPTPVSGPPSPAVSPVVANPISLTSAGTASLGQPTNASSPVNVFSPADYGPPSPIFDPAPAPVDPNVDEFNSLIREGKFGEAGVLATGLGFTPEQIQSYLNDTNVFPEFGGGVTLETVQSIVSPPPPPVVSDSPPVVNQTSAPTTPPAYDIRDLFLEFLGREPKKQDLDNAQFLYGDKLDTPDEINEFITKSKQEILNRQSFPVNSLFEGGKQPSLEELRRVQNDPLTQALNSYDQYLLAGQYPEAKALLDSTIATYGLNPTESYANMATYLNTNPKFEDVRKVAGNKLFTGENIANFGKPLPLAPVGPAGGIYQRTPQEQAAYASQLASIPVNTAVPLPVMPMSIGPSAALTRARQPGDIGEQAYYGAIRDVVSGGQYTPAQLRQMQQQIGTSGQDINVAFGRGMTPISITAPTLPGATADTTQSIDQFIQSKAPTTSVAMPTAPSMFSPENVRAQLELERLRLQPTPEPPPEEPVAGFAQGGLVSDDINRMLQNQRNAIQRESQSRQMLNTLGAPPVKKFSDGGPAGSSSGVRRLEMSGYQEGGEVTDEMFVGTAPSEESQQTTGEYIKGLYKENIPVHARVYLETLLGKKDPITAEDFTKDELARIDSLIQKTEAERLGKTLKNQADLQSSLERTIKRLSPQKDIAKKMVEDPDWIAYGELDKKPTSPEVANERFDAWTRFYNKFADQAFVHEDITLIMGDRDPKKVQSYLDEKKQKNKQTTEYLKDRLSKVNQALDAVQGKGLKGAVDDYSAYGSTSPKEMEDTDISRTLGRFNYETLPSGRRVVKDTYDFYNEYRAPMVEEYEKMGPAKKALSVLLEAVKDPVQLPSVLGNAYIGRDGRPVKVEYDPKDLPVKRQEGSPPEGEVNENPYVRMAREERAAQDKAFDSVNRQLSDLLERYKEGDEGITEKDLLPFFPGYNEYDIAQMYGTTTESSVPSMSSKARSFTPEIMSNLRKHDELMQKDFDRLVKEKRLPRDVITARTLGLAKGGEVTNDEFIQEMMTGTRPTDQGTSPGILPPEIRQAVDVPLDFANLLIRGTAAVPIGGVAGLYKGLTGGKYGTQEGVKEADTEAARMMAKITGEPKTQAAKDVLEFIGGKAQEYKLDAALPQLLTLPSPGPGAASALMRSYELAETPPLGTVKLAGDKGVKPATPPTDQMGFYSPAEKAVMGLPQDKGTASQMLAQITKTQGVKPVELRATGLEDYLKGKGNAPVTKQEIQDFLTNNRVQVDEVVLGKGQTLSPEAKKLSGEALSRMEEVDDKLASYFEGVEEVAGQDPYSAFIMLRSSIGRRAAKGDQEALDELNAFNLPPEIKDLVLEFGRNKNEYIKYTSQARKMEKPKFDGYNTSGGTNAREIYLTLPGEQMPSSSPPSVNAQGVLVKPMYATQPKFTAPPQHSVSPEADTNRLAHIFLDERKDAKGNNVLFVQEMQSDWAQIGKKKGFQTKTTPYDDPEYKAARARATDLLNEFNRNNANPVRQQEIRPLLDEARRVEQSFEDSRQRLPAAPFVTNTEDWVNLALKRVIKEAVDNDIDTVAFIKGGQAADKYSLRTFVDYISADRGFATGDDLYVSITPKDSLSPHAFYVGPDGIIKEPISADVRSKFLGEPLSKVIGKETAEKLLSTKIGESQVLRDEGLTLGGKGMEGFYDNILPKTAEKLLKKLGGGKVEPVEMVKAAPSQMPYEANAFLHWMSFRHPGTSRSDAARAWGMGMDNNQFVKEFYEETTPKADQYLGFKITPEMKEMVKTEGLPKFAAGGEVTDFIKRAA